MLKKENEIDSIFDHLNLNFINLIIWILIKKGLN